MAINAVQSEESNLTIHDAFWSERIDIVIQKMLPFQWRVLNDEEPDVPKSGAIQNFKIAAGEAEGEFYGMVFQDTDLHKWIEAVAYALRLRTDDELKAHADEAWRLIAKSQMPDGYVDTYFQIKAPKLRWTSLQDNHELYTAGHLIEAGVAYHQSTGSEVAKHVVIKLADGLVQRFLKDKTPGMPGHPEVELALMRLYRMTGNKDYYELAKHFILIRGQKPNYFEQETQNRRDNDIPNWLDELWNDGNIDKKEPVDLAYYVASKPLLEQSVVEGHAVRAGYLYAGLADIAEVSQNDAIKAATMRLWHNMTDTQMYVTGGIGSTNMNEGFTHEYDLPTETNYSETCAGISLIFFAHRLQKFMTDGVFGDVIERDLYNNTLGSMSLSGEKFYYRNEIERWGENVARSGRPGWHACACCPPNLARLILSLDHYIAHTNGEIQYLDQYISSSYDDERHAWNLTSDFPVTGEVSIVFEKWSDNRNFATRIPSWSPNFTISLNNKPLYVGIDYVMVQGYIQLIKKPEAGDKLSLNFDMTPKTVYANSRVKSVAGRVAITRGPLVYCAEEVDNKISDFWNVLIPQHTQWTDSIIDELPGVTALTTTVNYEMSQSLRLYSYNRPEKRTIQLTLVPFYARNNRQLGAMQVYLRSES